jgi:2-phosphosulfolactate phosphatase
MTGPSVGVCFSPALLPGTEQKAGLNVVVVDILRATTAMCTAFGYGLASVVPLSDPVEALEKKRQGWLVAGEQDGIKLPFADFGNSPLEFRNSSISGKDIIFCTTNGTKAIQMAAPFGKVFLASFVNLEAMCAWLGREGQDVLILCAGWKDSFCLEDSLFAGALADLLVRSHGFIPENDSALAAIALWKQSSGWLMKTVSRASHFIRLLEIEGSKGLEYCFFPEMFPVIPAMQDKREKDLQFTIYNLQFISHRGSQRKSQRAQRKSV